MSFTAFVEDGDGGNGGAGGVCWNGLAGAVGKEGDAIGADETNLCLLSGWDSAVVVRYMMVGKEKLTSSSKTQTSSYLSQDRGPDYRHSRSS